MIGKERAKVHRCEARVWYLVNLLMLVGTLAFLLKYKTAAVM